MTKEQVDQNSEEVKEVNGGKEEEEYEATNLSGKLKFKEVAQEIVKDLPNLLKLK